MSRLVSLSVVSLLLLLFFFIFFFAIFFFNPSPGAAESFSTQFRKNKAFTQWLRWNGEDIQPRAELGPLNTTLAFPACLCVFSWEKVTLIWHGYIHNEHRSLNGGAQGNREGICGVNVTAA